MIKSIRTIALFIMAGSMAITGCKKEKTPEPEKPKATFSDIEIGLGNNEMGTIGKDFHFNGSIVAGDKIDYVKIKIVQRNTETYSKVWSHEVNWTEFKGAKNTNVHKHFTIPKEAAEGKYDFLIIVGDENGTITEEKRTVSLYLPENLPIDPAFTTYLVVNMQTDKFLYATTQSGPLPEEGRIKTVYKNDVINTMLLGLFRVKGDGKVLAFLVNKKHNHKPETISQVDLSKIIVLYNGEHKDVATTSNYTFRPSGSLTVGVSTNDLHTTPGAITGNKAWENGDYYVGLLYHNTTHNAHLFEYSTTFKIEL